jgi:TonB family protein
MFAQLNPQSNRSRRILAVSVGAHAALLVGLLFPPTPMLINPVSIRIGRNGRSLSRLYFPTPSPDDSKTSSSAEAKEKYRQQRVGHDKLVLHKDTRLAQRLSLPTIKTPAQDNSQSQTLASLGHGAPAGLPYGALNRGPAFGSDIRPALPVATSDPVVYPWQLPDSEGNVVVEITIDERGEIISKTVLQSMGANIDEKVLAALENWRFRPATKDGSPIASKQDAVFHFRARG